MGRPLLATWRHLKATSLFAFTTILRKTVVPLLVMIELIFI